MKHNVIRYSMIVLLIGLVALAAGRTYAQTQPDNGLVFLSGSFGITPELTARVSVAHLGGGSVKVLTPAITTIQILGPEGNVIAQSDEIRVEPGQIKFWDAPRDLIPVSGEPGTGRLQVRTRIVVTTSATDFDLESLMPTIEVIDNITGRTLHSAGKTFLIFVPTP